MSEKANQPTNRKMVLDDYTLKGKYKDALQAIDYRLDEFKTELKNYSSFYKSDLLQLIKKHEKYKAHFELLSKYDLSEYPDHLEAYERILEKLEYNELLLNCIKIGRDFDANDTSEKSFLIY